MRRCRSGSLGPWESVEAAKWAAVVLLSVLSASGCAVEESTREPAGEDPAQQCVSDCNNLAAPTVAEHTPRECMPEPCPAPLDAAIRVRFSEPINPAFGGGGTADCGGSLNLTLAGVDPTVGPCLTGTISGDGVELILQPDAPLLASTRYAAHVSTRVRDLSGQALAMPFSWEFVTQQAAACGNGELSADEACDDGNLEAGDYCAPDCSAVTGSCGDGQLQAALEVCDDGNEISADGCSVRCAVEFREPLLIPGNGHTCGIRRDGSLRCWGGQATEAPDGEFTELAVGADFACALDGAGALSCWGGSSLSMQTGLTTIAAGGGHLCGIDGAGAVSCFDAPSGAPALQPPAGLSASHVVVGEDQACALDAAGAVQCWGGAASAPPAGLSGLRDVALGDGFGCALGGGGEVQCWGGGDSDVGLRMPPGGSFVQLAAGASTICALKDGGGVTCWSAAGGAALMPSGSDFVRIEMGPSHGCGITGDDRGHCWGDGPTDVPGDFP